MNDQHSQTDSSNLQKVLEISRAMVATENLDSLLELVVQCSMDLLNSERATVFLYDEPNNQIVSRIAAGETEIRAPADRGIAGETISTGTTIVVPDAYKDDRFNPEVDKATGFHTRNILSVPLRSYVGSMVGVLQVLNKREGSFGDSDVMLAETLAAQAGVAIQRARLIDHYLKKQQMERAMRIARDIQQGLLPEANPKVCGFDIAGLSDPADATGGDVYDFMAAPHGRWAMIVADATGHGIGPALVIAETRAMLRAVCLQGAEVPVVMQTVNGLLASDLTDGRFVTCFFAVLDPLAATLTFASAGHGPILFYSRKSDNFSELPATGLPLGVLKEANFSLVSELKFEHGDFAVVTTDGFFEATNAADEQFGVERIKASLRRNRDLKAKEMIDNLHAEVNDYTAGLSQADDLTAIAIRRK